jgi:hypothetical protein
MFNLICLSQSVEHKRAEEAAADGMLIVKARYGDLATPGGFIDVTDQVRARMRASRVVSRRVCVCAARLSVSRGGAQSRAASIGHTLLVVTKQKPKFGSR